MYVTNGHYATKRFYLTHTQSGGKMADIEQQNAAEDLAVLSREYCHRNDFRRFHYFFHSIVNIFVRFLFHCYLIFYCLDDIK